MMILAGIPFVSIAFAHIPFPFIIISAGVAGWAIGKFVPLWFPVSGHSDESSLDSSSTLSADDSVIEKATRRQAVSAAFIRAVPTFGGAYAVLGYITQQAVERFSWISPS
jgi:chromate transporter